MQWRSLPSWECGLKSELKVIRGISRRSLPSWECGLKSTVKKGEMGNHVVTPFVGVWIEIV